MHTKKHLTLDAKKAIVSMLNSGYSSRQVAPHFGVDKSTVNRIFKAFGKLGCCERLIGSGRRRKTTRQMDMEIMKLSRANPKLNACDIYSDLREHSRYMGSKKTIQRRLRELGLYGRRPACKPYVSEKNRKTRLEFAKEHLNWTVKEWSNVIWTDESKFNLYGSDGIQYIRRPIAKRFDPQYMKPTVKHGGGNVMVWGAFSFRGIGPIHYVESIMTGESYKDILNNVFLPWARQTHGRSFILQQDNDPKHTSGVVKAYVSNKRWNVLKWPSHSPDLNPIEHLWEVLQRRCAHKHVTCKGQKFQILKQEWSKIDMHVAQTLIESMPARCAAVIKSKGYPTKY